MEAFKKVLATFPNSRLVIAGTGDLPEILQAAAPHWAHITLTGFINPDALKQLYAVADVGVMPSLMEQCSYTAIEMRFHKIPIIVSAVDGLDEMYEHEVDALKVPVHYTSKGIRILQPEEIAKSIIRLLKDEALAKQLAENSHEKGLQLFTAERMGEEYLKIIEEMAT